MESLERGMKPVASRGTARSEYIGVPLVLWSPEGELV
jgi:hypothetical protein